MRRIDGIGYRLHPTGNGGVQNDQFGIAGGAAEGLDEVRGGVGVDQIGCAGGCEAAAVGGGSGDGAGGHCATGGGGTLSRASGYGATVAGGEYNIASGGQSTVAGGVGNNASGFYAMVGGGYSNTANGSYSFAAGISANDGGFNNVFIWGDSGGGTATGPNQFNVHASGGIILNGVVLHASDRNLKEDFAAVSAREVLDKVLKMPVSTWRFKSEDDTVRHIGPMAQDFKAAFGYGVSDKHITATDADGVALAAIQGLNLKLEDTRGELAQKQTEIDRLEAELAKQRATSDERFASLEQRLLAMEASMN